MSKIIQFHDYTDAGSAIDTARQLLQDRHQDLALENQQLLLEVMKLEDQKESQRLLSANLRAQLLDAQDENELLLNILQQDNPSQGIERLIKQRKQADRQQQYWEQEYGQLKDKIRQLENALSAKNSALLKAQEQTEQLLNEILSKD